MSFSLKRERTDEAMTLPALFEPSLTFADVDASMRRDIEMQRLLRILGTASRAPTAGELERLSAVCKQINPKAAEGEYYLGMQGVPLTAQTAGALDMLGYGTLALDGLPCHLARLPGPAVEVSNPVERRDSVLLVLPNNRVRAIDRVLLHNDNKKVMLDGALCLRKLHISQEEHIRINTAWNPHERDYLEYYAAEDEQAFASGVDVTNDVHQSQYDEHYELVYAATTCLFAHARQINLPHIERATLVQSLTETQIVQDTTTAVKRRLEALHRAIEYAGGSDQLTLSVFLNPIWSTKHARAFMHALPSAVRGIFVTGVTFYPNEEAFMPLQTNPKVLEFAPQRTLIFMCERVGDDVQLCLRQGPIPDKIQCNTVHEERTKVRAAAGRLLECVGVRTDDDEIVWRPLRLAIGFDRAAGKERYDAACAAIKAPFGEEDIVRHLLRCVQQQPPSQQ